MAQGAPDGPGKVLGWPTIWIAAAIILTVTIGSGFVLFWIYPPPGSKEALDIIRTAGTLGVGTGGAAALLLHARRQRATEEANVIARKVNDENQYDATERRISELQASAGEQLGSDNAAVRLSALYQLERLGQKFREHRQTVVNLICAYLRMPWGYPTIEELVAGEKVDIDWRELQVRLTAQRILAEHLAVTTRQAPRKDDVGRHWAGMDVDLTGALLVDFRLSNCRVNRLVAQGAQFVLNSQEYIFVDSTFYGEVDLSRAQIHSAHDIRVEVCTFDDYADFSFVRFWSHVILDVSESVGGISLDRAEFTKGATVSGSLFCADISNVNIGGGQGLYFRNVKFSGSAFLDLESVDAEAAEVEFDECVADVDSAKRLRGNLPFGFRIGEESFEREGEEWFPIVAR